MQITALVVPCDEEEDIRKIEYEQGDIRFIQSVVEGTFTVTDLEQADASIFSNDEGLLLDLPFNRRATGMLYTFSPRHRGYTMLVGNCLVTGMPDEEGNTLAVPDELVKLVGA